MARILEAVRSSEAGASMPMAAPRSESKMTAPAVVAAAPPPLPDIPFIEVGGATIDGSPEVMAVSVPGPFLPHPAVAVATREAAPEIVFESVADALIPADPENRFAPELIAYHDPGHPVSQQYEELLDHVLSCAATPAVLLFSGGAEGAGTTTAVLNLAITLAARGGRVAVVDACVAKPAIAARLGLPTMPGLSEVFAGEVSLLRALRDSGQANLTILTSGEQACRPSLAMRSFPGVLGQLRKRFDQIFVDSPAWHDAPEMASLAACCDAMFLVAPHGNYDDPEIRRLLRRLPRQGIRLAGCVVTHRTAT
jgi:Mrp family chromosome partitioning ATPase